MLLRRYYHTGSLLVIFCLVIFAEPGLSQNYQVTDTSYFVSWDDDFNLILSADKGDIANVNLLLKRGADVNAATIDGITPLMYATRNGNLEMVSILVDSAANMNKRPFNGATALIEASRQNFYDIAEFLVKKGAKTDIQDINGVTAVHYAAVYNNFDIMDMLLFYGADKELADKKGNTPIISASFNNSLESVDLLLQNGANVNARDENDNTALIAAIQMENHDIAYLLLDNGADINAINGGGLSALFFAVMTQDLPLVEELVTRGANVNQPNKMGFSLLELAEARKNDPISEYLKSHGAGTSGKPSFNRTSVGAVLDFNTTDFMNGIHIGIQDHKYQLGINSGFVFRPSPVRVLTDISNTTYQFWERRYIIYLGVEKRFKIIETANSLHTGPYAGVNEAFTFGGYRGSDSHPDKRFITSPVAGWYFSKPRYAFRIGYEYMALKTEGISNHRLTMNFTYFIRNMNTKFINKRIDWLE